jgi:hypothetical protein
MADKRAGTMVTLESRLRIYCCYEERNKGYWDELEAHLAVFRRLGYVVVSCNHDVPAGAPQAKVIENYIETADIILLLVSAYFIASDFCWETALRALARLKAKEVCVIPILVTPVVLDGLPIEQLQMLPSTKKPISKWSDCDEAYTTVVRGIQNVLHSYQLVRSNEQRNSFLSEDE